MGKIFDEVVTSHLRHYPHEREALIPFQGEFDITWGARRTAYGSDFSSYIVRPEKAVREIFGLGMEVALFLFEYPTLEARTIQAITKAIEEEPMNGRVEPGVYFLVSRDPNAQRWASEYMMRTAQTRNIIALPIDKLRLAAADPYKLRDLIASFVYRRDLFDYKLPVYNDAYFFGRESVVSELADQAKKGQNTGVFGLRKTGKTSLLYKLSRHMSAHEIASSVYIDCKSPVIRKKSAEALSMYLAKTIAEASGVSPSRYSKLGGYEAYQEVARLASRRKPLCIIFDEIEYISPFSLTDPHWRIDFIDFWQLMWSVQSQGGVHVSYVICGVNASVCERDTFDSIQNPLFGIFNVMYLKGLDGDSMRRMVQYFGSQMGLKFSDASVGVLMDHYGGHPLLTRMACSYIHKDIEATKKGRPVGISNVYAESALVYCDADMAPYCTHIVSELKSFYPDEFEVLKMAAVGQRAEFLEYARDVDLSRHLKSYGIVHMSEDGVPSISLPVLANYLRSQNARANGQRLSRELVVKARRETWVKDVVSRIIHDLRMVLQALPREAKQPLGSRGIPDSDLFNAMTAVNDESDLAGFLTAAYKVFYENVLRSYGKGEFFGEFKSEWPALFLAVNRIRVYRDNLLHLDVSEASRSEYEKFLAQDLDGLRPAALDDGFFAVQQIILDELLYAVQMEAVAHEK